MKSVQFALLAALLLSLGGCSAGTAPPSRLHDYYTPEGQLYCVVTDDKLSTTQRRLAVSPASGFHITEVRLCIEYTDGTTSEVVIEPPLLFKNYTITKRVKKVTLKIQGYQDLVGDPDRRGLIVQEDVTP